MLRTPRGTQGALACVIVALVLVPTAARGQGFDAERFVPAAGASSAFLIERPILPGHLDLGVGLFAQYGWNPVVVRDDADNVVARPLEHDLSFDLIGSIGLFRYLELGLHLPLHLVYEGDSAIDAGGTLVAAGRGIGDLRVVPKVGWQTRSGSTVYAIGAAFPVGLPTGDAEELRGAGDVTVEPRLLAATGSTSWGLFAQAGYRVHTDRDRSEGLGGDELTFGVGGTLGLTRLLVLTAEVVGARNPSLEGRDLVELPVEALGGVIIKPAPAWRVFAGAGAGLTNGVGAPDLRVALGVRYQSGGFRDRDGDGIYDLDDSCPSEAEDRDGFEDGDGCPDRDNDQDGIPDEDDECPDAPDDDYDRDGCPTRTRVVIEDGKIYIMGKVRFETGSTALKPESEEILDQLAGALNEHPEIRKVRIEGHTDSVGDDGTNMKLSRDRAAAVKAGLVKRGVKPGRLTTVGYGETRPVASNRRERGRAKNRRVEFVAVER